MPIRTSTRQAAVKANEALHQNARAGTKASGSKRKGSAEDGSPEKKRGKNGLEKTQAAPTTSEPIREKHGPKKQATGEAMKPSAKEEKEHQEQAPRIEVKGEGMQQGIAVQEKELPSNVLERGIIYFFFRRRVGIEQPEGVDDVARTFIVLRPLPPDANLGQGPIGDDANCRLLVLPKKTLPSSARERYMGFVEKAGTSLKAIKASFEGEEYETKTRGLREIPSATPAAEGVYAITSTSRSSHLAYILTIPEEPSKVQRDLGLKKKGSMIVSSKSPKFAGPASARLPKEPDYPQDILDDMRNLRWVPLEPRFLDYPNAQFLMIGEAQGKGGLTEEDQSREKELAGEELELLEHENELRASPLRDDHIIFQDLGLSSKEFSSMPTTWG
ncbi:hypothetical protein LOZ36_002052 [Ophidiomyces ophidiicola]|nr:hypothetical protein LOZ36_002052 [Ophidiomyces ophidiicola]